MTPKEICTIGRQAALQDPPSASDLALIALHDLVLQFVEATDGPNGCPASMKVMSIQQIALLNQLHLAIGL